MKSLEIKAVVILALAGLVTAGCPTSDSEPKVDLTVQNYCNQVSEVACWNMWNCCTGYEIEEMLGITISVEPRECRRDVKLICEDNLAVILWAAFKGSVRLDEEKATACMQSMLLAGECFQHVSEVPWERWCDEEHWLGTLQPGNECLYSFECVDGAYCAADRKCKAFPKRDQECEAYICAPGLFCDPRDGRCEDQKSSGQECWDDTWCDDGLYCQFDEEGQGTCMGLKSLGVGCKGHYQCESMFCIPGLCHNGGECFEDSDCLGSCSGSGDYCYDNDDCPAAAPFPTTRATRTGTAIRARPA